MTVEGEVVSFRSEIDGTEQRAGLCGPTDRAGRLPLLVEVQPGSITELERTLEKGRRYLAMVGEPAVWVRPGGRGPGTVFQGYGEVDVFEAIETAATRYPIDRDRISLLGASMGGAATWYLGSHHPDRFAAIAPFCGYNDYRLWTRPGGMTFPLMPWEEASWRARSAIFLMENLRHVGIWMVHGAWDRAVGGGVDVAHSRNSAARLQALGIPYRYDELPATGHGVLDKDADLMQRLLRWLVAQRRPTSPGRLTFTTYELRHPRAYWLEVLQLGRYGGVPGRVAAHASAEAVTIQTENVRHLAVGPVPQVGHAARLVVDGAPIRGADPRERVGVRRDPAGAWLLAEPEAPRGEKRPGVSGPFGDLFRRGTILVPGTTGTAEERFFLDWCAGEAARFYRAWNGGVHRGGIPGESWVTVPVRPDTAFLADPDPGCNVVALGTPATNALLARLADRLPLRFGAGEIQVGGRSFRGAKVAVIALLPHPDGGDRYLAVHGGATPDAITHGAHFGWQLLPDWLVYDGDRVLGWGSFDNDWRIQGEPGD